MESFEAVNFKKRFEGVIALKDANFKFEGSKICGLVGANGSGKTTFARICSGIIQRDGGELFIDGEKAAIDSPHDARNYGIVLAHQNLSLIPDLTVWENINLGHEKRQRAIFLNNKDAKEKSQEILNDLIPGEISMDEAVVNLTPAHSQMVEIAKALSQDPRLLILDEPTAALEYFHVEQLFKKIEELKKEKISIIFISHRLWEITRICDMVFVFRNGETAGTVDFQEKPRDEHLIVPLVTGEIGKTISFSKKKKVDFAKAEVLLELKNISYREKLKNISFKVKTGEVLGIGGLHGQGQEKLIMLLSGALHATEGEIFLRNNKLRIKHPKDAIKNGVYLVPGDRQQDGLFIIHSIFNNAVFPRFCLKMDGIFLNFTKLSAITDKMIERAELVPPDRKMLVKNLSGGNQQKVVFGRWLQFSPSILLLNDPAKGIDIQAKEALYKIMHELGDAGTTVILYASSNEELITHCDRVLIMFEGQIAEEIVHDDICDEKLIKSSLRVGG